MSDHIENNESFATSKIETRHKTVTSENNEKKATMILKMITIVITLIIKGTNNQHLLPNIQVTEITTHNLTCNLP